MPHRCFLGAALVAVFSTTVPSSAEAVELRPAGGMGITFWFMSVDLTERSHSGVGIGISGRVMLRVGNHLRLQAGLLQGRFTEDDDSHVKRNLIMASAGFFQPLSGNFYFTAGARLGADHLDMIETIESVSGARRLVHDVDRWSFAWEPFLTLGLLVGHKYHFELETGSCFSYADGRVHITYTVVFGVYFAMGGNRGSLDGREASRIGHAEGGDQ